MMLTQTDLPNPSVRSAFDNPLLNWYRQAHRDLPWRRMQDNPYAVWISEIMCQQTQVATVIPYFLRWIEQFPTLEALAQADLYEVLRMWSGLGYYARARNLHKTAQLVASRHGGCLPGSQSELLALPGIGRYTAGAILSIVYNQSAPIVDANVERVYARVFALGGDPRSRETKPLLWHLAKELIPNGQARIYNQAIMELGALVCTPSDPLCSSCPLIAVCKAGNCDDPTRWPELPPGKRAVPATHCCIILLKDRECLVIQRPPHGLWGGLYEFPRRACEPGEDHPACAARAAREIVGVEALLHRCIGTVKHSVMHYNITLHGYFGTIREGDPRTLDCTAVMWVELENLMDLPLASPQKQMIKRMLPHLISSP